MHGDQWTVLITWSSSAVPQGHISQCPGMMEPPECATLTCTFSALLSLSLSRELFITSGGESWWFHRQQFVFTKAVGVLFTDGQLSCTETEIKPFPAGFRPPFRHLGCSFNFFHGFILIFVVLSAAFNNLYGWSTGLQVKLVDLWNPEGCFTIQNFSQHLVF